MTLNFNAGDGEGALYGLVATWVGKTFNLLGAITPSAAWDAAIISLIGVTVGFIGKRLLELGEKKTLELIAKWKKKRKKTQ